MSRFFSKKGFQKIAGILACALALGAFSSSAHATEFPSKLVTLYVGGPAGGAMDVLTRALARSLSTVWKTTVIVENRPGAASLLGAMHVAKSKPDGYSIGLASTAIFIGKALNGSSIGFDPVTDVVPVSMIVDVPFALFVHPSVPAKSLNELIAYAKANPGKLQYGTGGSGSTGHIYGSVLQQLTGTKVSEVHYRSAMEALQATAAGEVQFGFADTNSIAPQARKGAVVTLAVASNKRSGWLPDVPTMAEAGLPNFIEPTWLGIFTTAGVPRDILLKLNRDVNLAAQSEEMAPFVKAFGDVRATESLDELQALMKQESVKWTDVVVKTGIEGQR